MELHLQIGIEAYASNDSIYQTKQEEKQIGIKIHYLFIFLNCLLSQPLRSLTCKIICLALKRLNSLYFILLQTDSRLHSDPFSCLNLC